MGFFSEKKLKEVRQKKEVPKEHTILIVDDEPENLTNLRGILEREFNILMATNGQEAIDLVTNDPNPERIHLIISDQRMPELTGVEFLEKTIAIIPQAIRIILTAFADIDSIIDAINKGGIYKFILKPFDRHDLILTVRRALESYVLEQKNVQLMDELKSWNVSLEEKVRVRTAELQSAYQTIKEQQEKLNHELEVARETQKRLMPKTLPALPGAKFASRYRPVSHIGGDFYNVVALDDESYAIYVADVTGHGPSAALISFLASGIISEAIKMGGSPATMLNHANIMLDEQLADEKFVSMFFATFNIRTRNFIYANAGHPPAVVVRPKTSEVLALTYHGPPVGAFPPRLVTYEDRELQLMNEDRVLIHTDAINECLSESRKMMGLEKLHGFIKNHFDLPLESLLDEVYNFALDYSNSSNLDDDCTMLGLELN